jgi:chromosome segregation ATPase
MVANMSEQGKYANSTESGIQDGSNQYAYPLSQQGNIFVLSNLKRKMEEIDHKRAAFKIEQSKLEKEVSTVTCSLTRLTEDILGMRRDMTQMSTSIRSEMAQIKNMILNMSTNKRGRKQQKGEKNRWKYMMRLLTIWKRLGTACVSPKMT